MRVKKARVAAQQLVKTLQLKLFLFLVKIGAFELNDKPAFDKHNNNKR